MERTPRLEPKGITLSDLMVVVAGVAIGYALGPVSAEPSRLFIGLGAYTIIANQPYTPPTRPGFIAAFAVALAIVARRVRYGGWPRVGVWPSLVAAGHILGMVVLFRAYATAFPGGNMTEQSVPPPDFPAWRPDRWPWAVGWSLASLCLTASLVMLRHRSPGWLGAIGITTVATMLICGPIHVFAMSGAFHGTMSNTTGTAPIDLWWNYFRNDTCRNLVLWPEWLLYGVPTVAALSDLRRNGPRSRVWTEWASLAVMLVLAALWCLAYLIYSVPIGGVFTLANVMARGLLLLGVALTSWSIIKVCSMLRYRWRLMRPLQSV